MRWSTPVLFYSIPPFCMNKWIERSLYRLFGWWRWGRRWRGINHYMLNAFCAERVRVLVSEPNNRQQHEIYVERRGHDEQWRRVASVREDEFPKLMPLLVDAYNYLQPDARRWKVVPQ
jgi:hypothetical protein